MQFSESFLAVMLREAGPVGTYEVGVRSGTAAPSSQRQPA
jgi:hypothetical protein